jgi:hypothetical protein
VRQLGNPSPSAEAAQALIEELLVTALGLGAVLSSLLEEMPEDAFPGEDSAAVLLEMVVGSSRPAAEAAGEMQCWEASALIGAVRDRVLTDLRAAAEVARRDR